MKKKRTIWAFRQTVYLMYKGKKISLSSDFLAILNTVIQLNNIVKIYKQEKLSQYLIFTQTGQR